MVTKAKKALLASLAAFLCVMLTVFGLSMSVSTAKIAKADDTTAVAKIGETNYAKLSDAVTAATEGNTVTLLADTTEDVVVDKNITLDLGGKALTGKNSGKPTLTIAKGATATVKNGSVNGTSSFYNIQNNGTATFESLTATAGNTGASMIDNWGTLTITSGTYTGGLNVVKSEENSTLVINGGEFTLDYCPDSGYTAVILVYGDTTINGGKFIQNATKKWANPQVVMTGVVDGAEAPITRVTGGTFTNNSGKTNDIFHGYTPATSDNFKVSGGTFNKPISEGYCAEGFIPSTTKNADGMYGVKEGKYVAKVGSTKYETLKDAFNALKSGSYKLTLLDENVWDASTPVYWRVNSDKSGYTKTLAEALTAVYKANGRVTCKIVCRPGADVGTLTHGHVADSINIYGNNAYISGGECDLEVDTFKFSRTTGAQANDGVALDKDITINAYELDNLGVWGQRTTNHKVTVNLTDCDGKEIAGNNNVQRVYISGTAGVNNLTIKKCDFLTKATSIYSNADGRIVVDNCTFTGSQVPLNINHKADGAVTLEVTNSTFTSCGDAGEWKKFAAPARFVNSGSGTMTVTAKKLTFKDTVGSNGDILLGDGREGEKSNGVTLKVTSTAANIQAQKPGYYNTDGTTNETKGGTLAAVATESYTTTVEDLAPEKGTEKNPYTLEELGAMTRAEYIAAQEKLGGTMYVTVGDYSYDKNGVLGNGVRNDTPGQVPDHSKLNAYGENGYLGENNDGANGKNIVFVGGSITSGVTGYASIDNIGTSLLLAVPAYTNVTFKGTAFNNVMSFDYQLYTSPWSQLGELKFDGCTFNGLIVGAIASQTLTFNGCTFTNYTNTVSANNSNPTWIRPAYGNWTKGDNEGQGGDFKSLTTINFTGNTVTSTRPVKFERIAQWEVATTVTATENTFTISAQEGDTSTKNVGLYLGANAKFGLVVEGNQKSGSTAALYTAVYSAPSGVSYAGLPAGSTVTDTKGNAVTVEDAYEWKTTTELTLETTTEVVEVNGVKFATLAEAIAAAKDGDTVKLLAVVAENVVIDADKNFTLDLNGFTLNGGTGTAEAAITNHGTLTITDSSAKKTGTIKRDDNGTVGETSYYVIRNLGTMTIEQANVVNNSGYRKTNPSGSMVGSSLICNGDNDEGAKLTIKGGNLTQRNFIAIKNGANGTLVVNGGEITSNHSAVQNWFNAELTGGTIRGQLWTDAWKEGESVGNTVIGGNVDYEGEIVMDVTGSTKPELKVDGGNLSVTNWRITTACAKAGGKPAVQGGTFTSAVPAEYCAEGFIPQDNGDGTYGVKVGTYVAKIGEVGYETLAEAIAAAKDGDTVTLLANVADFEGAVVTKNLTFDFGDYTITGKTGATVLHVKNAKVTLNGKTGGIDGGAGGDNIAVRADTGAEVIINGGVYTVGADANGLGNSTVYVTDNGKVTINGGTFSSKAAYNGKYYVLNVQNSAKGTFEVKGGTFKDFDPLSGDDNLGGNFAPEGYGANRDENGNFTIVAGVVAQVKNANGKSVKAYATLEEALNAAPRKAIVMLLADTKENVTITQMYITLDLNGYTINGGTEKGKPAVTVTARVTIKDSSAAQTGTIMREDTADNSGVSSHYVIDVQDGWLTFEGGKVINNSGNVAGKGASLVRVGNDSVDKYPGLNIKGGTFTQNNFIVIKIDSGDLFLNGGTLTSANSYAIENWHRATVKGGTVNGAVSSWTYSGGFNSTLTISGGTINGKVESVTYDGAAGKLAKVSITGGTVTGTLSHSVYNQSVEADKTMATIEVSGGTFSTDPTKYVVEDSAITENENGTYGVEKAYLAKVGETSYYTMDEAFKAQTASGEAIVLLRDYTTGSTFSSGTKHRVVDLNGHTWTYTGTDTNSAAFEINYSNATLTVKNGTIISSTIVGLIPSAMGGTIMYDNAGLVFEGVEMTSNGSSGIETNGNNTNDSVTLKDSTLNVPNGFGIYFPSSGTLTINNSTINAKTMGVQVCSGELNINAGSAITVMGDAVTKTENDGAIQDGAAISIVNRTGYKGLSNIVITGGTFTAKAGNDAIKAYDWANKVESEFTKADLVAVSGGTFSSEVKKDYLADRFVVNKNTDGTYGVTAGSGFAGANVVVTESLAMKVTIANGTASKYVVVTYKGLDGIDKSVKLDTLTDGYYLFDRIMPQMIDVKFSFELYGENDVMLDRKANYSVVDYLAHIIASDKDSVAFRNVAASLIEYANRAKVVKGLTTTVAPTFVDKDKNVVTLDYNAFVAKNKIPAKDTLGAISEGDGQVIYKARVVFDDAYTLKFYTNAGDGYTYTLSKNGSTEEEKGITFDKNGEFTINVLAQDITTQYVIKVYGEDKTQPIQTVTYGVSTYCIRMQGTETPQGELYVASYYYGVAVQQYGAANTASVQV